MKVSTDAAVLGALAEAVFPQRILDIGTGTGVLALMLAQRYLNAKIWAVEIDADASEQARANVAASPWSHRVQVVHRSFQEFYVSEQRKFDLIVSNPPYYADHLPSTNGKKHIALHQDTLAFFELAKGMEALLADDGVAWVILPPRQMSEFETVAATFGLLGMAKVQVFDRPGKPVLREVQGFSSRVPEGDFHTQTLIIKDTEGLYTADYRALLQAYLLHF